MYNDVMCAREPNFTVGVFPSSPPLLRLCCKLRAPYPPTLAPHLPEPSENTPPSELNKNPPEGVSVGLADDDNMFMWELLLVGPADTVSARLPRLLR